MHQESPLNCSEMLSYGEALFSQGRSADAIRCLEEVLAREPSNVDALNNLGVIAFQLGATNTAEGLFIRALRLDRRNRDSLCNLAEIRRAEGRCEEADSIVGMDPPGDLSSKGPVNEVNGCPKTPSPKRIFVINNLYPPQELGGYGRVMADYVNLLKERGHKVQVVTSDTRYLGDPGAQEAHVERPLSLFGEWSSRGMVEYERDVILSTIRRNHVVIHDALNRFQPHICLVGNIDLLSVLVFAPLFERNIPVLHRLGSEFVGYPVSDTPRTPLYHVVTDGRWLKEDALHRGYPFERAYVIHSGAFVREFRMPFPPATDKLRIAFAGLVNAYKGPQVLVRALHLLDQRGIQFSFTLAGGTFDPGFVTGLKESVREMGLSDKVTFAGRLHRQGLKDLYARHNVLVFPSMVNETFGISQVEAMAAGLLVITSGKGGAREVVEDGVSGLHFEPGDHDRLAGQLQGLLTNRERWEEIAANGRRRAMEEFDIERSVDKLERAFEEMVGRE